MKRLSLIGATCAGLLSLVLFSSCGGGTSADTSPPSIISVNVSRLADTGGIEVLAQVSDAESGVSRVVLQAAGISQEITMQPAPQGDMYRVVLPAETGHFRVRAIDKAGNEAVSGEYRVPPPNPPAF